MLLLRSFRAVRIMAVVARLRVSAQLRGVVTVAVARRGVCGSVRWGIRESQEQHAARALPGTDSNGLARG